MSHSPFQPGTSHIQPVVLVGGKSRRFGSDKLVAPIDSSGRLLAQQPIDVLRTIFGSRIKLVGECDQRLLACANGQIFDLHPGLGPLGGVISALSACTSDSGALSTPPDLDAIFVLAGDMPSVAPDDIRSILLAAAAHPDAWAVLAMTDTLQPCAGLYRLAALPALEDARRTNRLSLAAAVPSERIQTVPWPGHSAHNVNHIEDLPAVHPQPAESSLRPSPTDPPTSPATLPR